MHALARALLLMAMTLNATVSAPSESVSPQSREANTTGTLAGRVTIAGKPAANVPVAVMPDPQRAPRERFIGSSTTDADGHFQITHMPAGRFSVMAVPPPFFFQKENNDYQEGNMVTLAEGEKGADTHIPF